MAALCRVGLLVAVCALIWIAHHDKWTAESWRVPVEYLGDAPETLAEMKAASEGAMWPLRPKEVERLGAPFGAHWNAYPTPDKPLLLLVGGLAHLIGLFAAANVVVMLAPITAALAFYFVARRMRVRWEWAWAGALWFAFAYHTFHRGLGHFSLAFSWTVPLGVFAVWLVAQSRRLTWWSGGAAVCALAAVGFAVGNPYNFFFWLQLMGWALLAQWFGARRRENLAIGLATLGLAGATFLAANLELWLYVQEPQGAPLLTRNYGGTELYALKPMELVLPPAFHRWDALAAFTQTYLRWSVWRGEMYFPYLGVIGAVGLGWLGWVTLRRVFARRALPGQALSIGWLVAYAAVGGLTNLVALVVGFRTFRATNRVAVFISAIVLVFLIVRLSRATVRWPVWTRVGLAAALALIGVLDQVPRARDARQQAELAAIVRADAAFTREVEAALPRGAMVFQLPVIGFPETGPRVRLQDYELFTPYLHSEHLRFSYGAAKFRARSRWQRDLENAPVETLVPRLERYGFAALHINRRGYEDRADRLLRELDALGYQRRIEGAGGQQVVVLLRPSAKPVPPLSRTLTFGRGWRLRPENTIRWAREAGVLSYFNPHPHPVSADIDFQLVSAHGGTVALARGAESLGSTTLRGEPAALRLRGVQLRPGVNVFTLRTSVPEVRGSGEGDRFGVQACSVRVPSRMAGDIALARVDSD